MAGNTTLDAPDLAVRRIMQKRADGQRLNDRELTRLGARMSSESETKRTGGTVKGTVTPRRISAYEQGQADREAQDGYAAGFEGRSPQNQATGRTLAGASAPASPVINRPGDEPDMPGAADENDDYLAANKSALKRAGMGGTNVNSYRGSIYAKPGSAMAATPLSAADNPGRSYGGDARTNFGRLSTPRTDIDAQGRPVKKAPPMAVGTDDDMPDETTTPARTPTPRRLY